MQRKQPTLFGLTIFNSERQPLNMYSGRNLFFLPNELWNTKAFILTPGINRFKMNETFMTFAINAHTDITINATYLHQLTYIHEWDYIGKRIKRSEHFATSRKSKTQKLALVSKGKEIDFYLNQGDTENISLPDSRNHQFSGKKFYGQSGFWGSLIEIENPKIHFRKGRRGSRLLHYSRF